MIPLIVLTNGRRDCISRTIPSAIEHLTGISYMVIVDDSGDAEYGAWLEREFPGDSLLPQPLIPQHPARGQHGYWQAMRTVWGLAEMLTDDPFFFLEDDFVFNEDIDVTRVARVLDEQPHLTQMTLLRQPWFTNEHTHGGLIPALEAQGQTFTERTDGEHHWIEHRACFTGNPSLIPKRTFEHPWPEGAWSESRFGKQLFADPAARGAYWGRRSDPPRVTHIGTERVGAEY